MKNVFEKDLYRFYGEAGESLFRRLLRPRELKYIAMLRRGQSTRFRPLRLWRTLRLWQYSQKTQIQIPLRTKIGEGFYIGHLGRVIIHPDAVLGRNVNIATGVTIGTENRGKRKGTPTVGDSCWIGTNAVIVGKIKIGSDVLIAPGSFVNFDVPDHSIVMGNPARIIPREGATEGYIQNPVGE